MDFDKPKVYGDTSIADGLVFLLHIHIQVLGDVQVHVHENGCGFNFEIFRQIYSLYTVSRSEKYHLVDLLLNLILNLLVHHPIHDHYHHLDFLVKLLVHHPIHDHLQAKICHFETFEHIKRLCCCPPPPSRPGCCCCPPPHTRQGRR